MSETVRYTGKIKEINIPNDLIEVKEIVKFVSLTFKIPEENFEIFNDEITYIDSSKVLFNFKTKKFYEVLEKKYCCSDDDFLIAERDNNVINFNLQFYKGGCSFNEAIIEAIEKIKDNDELETLTLSMSNEQIKNWLVDAYKTQSWSQINKLIVMFGV